MRQSQLGNGEPQQHPITSPSSLPKPFPSSSLRRRHGPGSTQQQGQDSRARAQMLPPARSQKQRFLPGSQLRGEADFWLMRRLRSLTPHLRAPLLARATSDRAPFIRQAARGRSLRRTWLSSGAAAQLMPARPWDYCFPDSSRHRYLWICFKMLSGHLFREMLKALLSCILNRLLRWLSWGWAALCRSFRQFYIYRERGGIREWFGLEGTLKIISFQPPCHGQGHPHLDEVAQSPVMGRDTFP